MQRYKLSELSKRSYQELTTSGKLAKYKTQIIAELKKQPLTRRLLAKIIKAGAPSNICAPLKELENEGIIKRIGHIKDSLTSREVALYSINDDANSLYINRNLSTCSLHETGLDHSKKSTL